MNQLQKLCLLFLFTVSTANAAEHWVWDKKPILLELPVGKERMISFEESVSLTYDAGLLENKLRVNNASGTLYLKALYSFDTTRAEVKLQSGRIILLDLQTNVDAPTTTLNVLMPKSQDRQVSQKTHRTVGYVNLTRHAIQQLYAPRRVLEKDKAIKRVPMKTTRLVPLYPLDDVKAMPLASYKDASYYVTAVMLRNQSEKPIRVSPKDLRGDFKAVAFYPAQNLKPRGDKLDSVTIFIVTDKPFSMSL